MFSPIYCISMIDKKFFNILIASIIVYTSENLLEIYFVFERLQEVTEKQQLDSVFHTSLLPGLIFNNIISLEERRTAYIAITWGHSVHFPTDQEPSEKNSVAYPLNKNTNRTISRTHRLAERRGMSTRFLLHPHKQLVALRKK